MAIQPFAALHVDVFALFANMLRLARYDLDRFPGSHSDHHPPQCIEPRDQRSQQRRIQAAHALNVAFDAVYQLVRFGHGLLGILSGIAGKTHIARDALTGRQNRLRGEVE